ncbi:MAG TPA: hypothetical protein VNM39_13300 [Verrucomicrobiae bacterium]|nr:hypothetical protein [Verrucomicrobiae bacterium]
MSPHNHNVKLVHGENSWLIARTDRDDAERSTVIESCGHALNRWLNNASPAGFRGVFQTLSTSPTGGRFVIGAARPILVTAARTRPAVPEGLRVASNVEKGQLPRRVAGKEPWYLSAVFTWHGPAIALPWPQHFGPVLGSELASDTELDWLLLEQWEARP